MFCELCTAGELLESLRYQNRALCVTDGRSYFRFFFRYIYKTFGAPRKTVQYFPFSDGASCQPTKSNGFYEM